MGDSGQANLHRQISTNFELLQQVTQVRVNSQCSYSIKPIFHRKLHSRWLPNANGMDKNNMKCTWSTRDPKRPLFHLLALSRLGVTMGKLGVALGPQGFQDTNMLVKATQNRHIGGLDQCETPTRVVSLCSGI